MMQIIDTARKKKDGENRLNKKREAKEVDCRGLYNSSRAKNWKNGNQGDFVAFILKAHVSLVLYWVLTIKNE